jgi:hypothetical protein
MENKNIIPIYLLLLGIVALLPLMSHAQTGISNNGAIMTIGEGAFLKITGGRAADFTNNIQGSNNPAIDLDGTITLEGDWLNYTASGNLFSNLNSKGEIVFRGNRLQRLTGPDSGHFEQITLNNPGGLTLNGNIIIRNKLVLSTGVLNINDRHLTLGPLAGISGSFGTSAMIAAEGDGQLRKAFTNNATFTFPLGDQKGTTEFTPLEFTLVDNNGLSSAWIGVNLTDEQHPRDTSSSEYISRYWSLTSKGISSPLYKAVFAYTEADITGDETKIYNARFRDGERWLYDIVDHANNQLVFNGMTEFSDFTGISGQPTSVSGTAKQGHSIDIYSSGNKLIVKIDEDKNLTEKRTTIDIYSMAGEKVYHKQVALHPGRNTIFPGLGTGYYIVHLVLNQHQHSAKVLLE